MTNDATVSQECPSVLALLAGSSNVPAHELIVAHLELCRPCRAIVSQVRDRALHAAEEVEDVDCTDAELIATEIAMLGGTLEGLVALYMHMADCSECRDVCAADDDAKTSRLPCLDPEYSPRLKFVVGNRYERGQEIAQGGMGRIYAALEYSLSRDVAIKEVVVGPRMSWGLRRQLLLRFRREVRLTARLQHPSIVPVFDAGYWLSGVPFYTMPLVRGMSLDKRIDACSGWRSIASEPGRIELLPNVLATVQAIAHAHAHGIVHRDLKPANIMIGDLGETIVIDWGLAKDLLADPKVPAETLVRHEANAGLVTEYGDVVGTRAYMAPEQAKGEPASVHSDIYALGSLLYHVVTGHPPRGMETREPTPEVARDLISIVSKAMHPDPALRYRTADAFADELARVRDGMKVGAHRYRVDERLARWVARNRRVLGFAAPLALVLLVTVLVGFVRVRDERGEARRQRAVAERQRDRAHAETQRATDTALAAAAHNLVHDDPTTATILLRGVGHPGQQSGWSSSAYALQRGAIAQRVFREHHAGVGWIAMDPTGAWVATASADGTATLRSLHARDPAIALRGHRGQVSWVSFIDEGRRLMTAGTDGAIGLWSVPGGQREYVLEHHRSAVEHVVLGPEGRLVASVDADGHGVLFDRTEQRRLDLPVSFEGHVRWLGLLPRLRGSDLPRVVIVASDGAVFVGPADDPTRIRVVATLGMGQWNGAVVDPKGKNLVAFDEGRHLRVVALDSSAQARTLPHGDEAIFARFDRGFLLVGREQGRLSVFRSLDDPAPIVLQGERRGWWTGWASVSRDGRRVVAGMGSVAHVWSLRGQHERIDVRGHGATIWRGTRFGRDSTEVLTASEDATARVWRLPAPVAVSREVPIAQFVDDDRWITADEAGHAALWGGLRSGRFSVQRELGPIAAARTTALGLVTAAQVEGAVDVEWIDQPRGPTTVTVPKECSSIVGVLPDGETVETSGERGRRCRVEIETGIVVARWERPVGRGQEVQSPDGSYRALGERDSHRGLLWQPGSSEPFVSFPTRAFDSPVGALRFAHHGSLLVTAGGDPLALELWSYPSMKLQRRFDFPQDYGGWVLELLPPEERRAIVSTEDTLQVVDLYATEDSRLTIAGLGSPLHAGAISPSGDWIAAGDMDGQVGLWRLTPSADRDADRPFATLSADSGRIESVEWSANGQWLLTRGNEVRVWSVRDIAGTRAALLRETEDCLSADERRVLWPRGTDVETDLAHCEAAVRDRGQENSLSSVTDPRNHP